MKRSTRSSSRGRGGQAPAVMANPMAEQVGPEFHDETGMRLALGTADEPLGVAEFARLCDERAVLAVAAFDGTRMFPSWQVVDGGVLAGLNGVLAAMAGQPAWSVGLWLTTSHDDLSGATPRACLESQKDVVRVVELAAETARRWS